MKAFLSFLLIIVLAVSLRANVVGFERRSNLNVGSIGARDGILLRQNVTIPRNPISRQFRDVRYRGNFTTVVSAVIALEIGDTQFGNAWIIEGGVRSNNVTIRLQTARGYGLNYRIEIWGR